MKKLLLAVVAIGLTSFGFVQAQEEIKIDEVNSKMRFLSLGSSQNAWIQTGKDWVSGSTSDLNFSGIYGVPLHMTLKSNGTLNIGDGTGSRELRLDGDNAKLRLLSWGGFDQVYIQTGKTWNSGSSADLVFSDMLSNTPKMIIKAGGNIGIGTASPQSLLAVNGKITAKEVQVTLSGWPDFVFKKDYKLQNLLEVEQFIKENNHLPEIPSEKEVCENGVSLGEMQAKLLQKIEELTLYAIEQQKVIEVLKEKVEKIESKKMK